jgi:hypothetical protein
MSNYNLQQETLVNTYSTNIPHGITWKGAFVDADLRAVEAVAGPSTLSRKDERLKDFMQLSSLQGSVLENRIFEDDFQVDSISMRWSPLVGQFCSWFKVEISSPHAAKITG